MKSMKVARGTARAKRRQDINRFREEQRNRAALLAESAWTVSMATKKVFPPPPAHVDVFTITDEGNGNYSAKLYEATKDYPASTPCPRRNLLHNYGWMTLPSALSLRDRKVGA